MKISLLALLPLATILSATQAHAFEVDGIEYEIKADGTVEVVEQWPAYSGDIVIPDHVTYQGRSRAVTGIARGAFADALDLTSVSLPQTITTIGNEAFRGCSSLSTLTIPNSVTSLGSRVLADCTSLRVLTISENVTEIPYAMCMNCTSLTQAVIPDKVTTIGSYSFNSTNVQTVTIGKSVTEIGNYAFEGCRSLSLLNVRDLKTWCQIDYFVAEQNPLYKAKQLAVDGELVRTVVLPEGITELKPYAFAYAVVDEVVMPSSLRSFHVLSLYYSRVSTLTIPDGVTEIKVSPSTTLTMNSLKSLTIGKGVKSIPVGAFTGVVGINSLTLSEGLEEIGTSAFSRISISEVVVPNSVKRIDSAFMQCLKLEKITLGRNLVEIVDNVCRGDTLLSKIQVYATDPKQMAFVGEGHFGQFAFSGQMKGPDKPNITLTVPRGCVQAYREAPVWCEFGTIVEDTSVRPGDVNGDGIIDIDDINIVINIMLRKASIDDYNREAVDLVSDGIIDIADVNYIINRVLRKA